MQCREIPVTVKWKRLFLDTLSSADGIGSMFRITEPRIV